MKGGKLLEPLRELFGDDKVVDLLESKVFNVRHVILFFICVCSCVVVNLSPLVDIALWRRALLESILCRY